MVQACDALDIIRTKNRDNPKWINQRLYRLLYNPTLHIMAYERLKSKPGNMTPGTDGKTLDGYSLGDIQKLIGLLRIEQYWPTPVRRVYIPKKAKGKYRPLGVPSPRDKIVQECIRLILEAIYEPNFHDNSHGFRSRRSCHTALESIRLNWVGTKWVIEADITKCFDRVNHAVLLKLLKRRIQDDRLLGLSEAFLKAGVLEDGLYRRTDLGTPQGGPLSPLLMNVYLHEFDVWLAERHIVPPHLADKGKSTHQRWRRQTHGGSIIPVRYADDWVVLWNGTKAEAERIKAEIAHFLWEELALTLSETKTRITHIDQGFTFLSYTFRRSRNRQTRKMNVFAQPSQENIRRYRRKVKEIASLMSVPDVMEIFLHYNRVTRGWAAYLRFANCKALFGRLAYYNWWTFCRALRKRHGKRSKRWVLNHYTHRVPSPMGTRTTLGIQVGDELLTMYNLVGVLIKRLQNPYSQAPNPHLEGATTKLDKPMELYPTWNGEESRPGQSRFSRVVRRRDKVCQRCGQAPAEEAHHLQPWSKRLTIDPAQGVGLCKACHIAIHR
jgi:RNA-directed DNA polymerase